MNQENIRLNSPKLETQIRKQRGPSLKVTRAKDDTNGVPRVPMKRRLQFEQSDTIQEEAFRNLARRSLSSKNLGNPVSSPECRLQPCIHLRIERLDVVLH